MGEGREGEEVWRALRGARSCATAIRPLASGYGKNRDLVSVFEAVVRGAAIVAEGTQKLAVPFPLVRQPGGWIAGLLSAAQQPGVGIAQGPQPFVGRDAFWIGGVGFVPTVSPSP